MNHWKDRLGIIASVVCAIHCAATPILLACLPAVAFTQWMASPRFHQIAAVACGVLVLLAIWPAFRKFQDYRVLSLAGVGIGLVISAAFFIPDQCCTYSVASESIADPLSSSESADQTSTLESAAAGHSHSALASVVSPELAALVQPSMTPLGGILLVIAHGMNIRRRVCSRDRLRCRCDSQPTKTGPVSLIAVKSNAA